MEGEGRGSGLVSARLERWGNLREEIIDSVRDIAERGDRKKAVCSGKKLCSSWRFLRRQERNMLGTKH